MNRSNSPIVPEEPPVSSADAALDQPTISAHWTTADETVIEIDWFSMPAHLRGRGLGQKAYEAWESQLPPSVKLVTLFAADSEGRGNSDPFWERLGFNWRWNAGDVSEMSYEAAHRMHKGVNGHPTPDSVWWIEDGDPEDTPDGVAPSAGFKP